MKENLLSNFSELGLNAALLKALEAERYATPTPIQAQAIPGVLAGRDLMGIAQTGTGKTAAFALPILHRLAANQRPPQRGSVRSLILSPTRELATQIADSFRTYGRNLDLTVAIMFGGVPHRPQARAMARGVDILVATPGRLIQHLDEGNVSLSGTEIFVLDEADQMLDMGFIRPIKHIVSKLSMKRQSLFFSATMPKEIGALAAELLRDPLRVAVTPVAKTADRVKQSIILVEPKRKQSVLVELFADPAMRRTLVFTRTKRGADRVARHLDAAGIQVAAIHGNKSQGQREAALGAFRKGRIRGLVATDIAARGIDIDDVTHVINFDLPEIPESYVHRIGRTARAGAEGIAISLCGTEERALLRDIERLTKQSIPSEDRRSHVAADEGDEEFAPARPAVRRGSPRNNAGPRGNGRPNGTNAAPAGPGKGAAPKKKRLHRGKRGQGGGWSTRGRPGGGGGRPQQSAAPAR